MRFFLPDCALSNGNNLFSPASASITTFFMKEKSTKNKPDMNLHSNIETVSNNYYLLPYCLYTL